jgi:hypothetical protein
MKNWKRGCAFVILYAFSYALAIQPALVWLCRLCGWAEPPALSWDLLGAGTVQLAVIGGIQTTREHLAGRRRISAAIAEKTSTAQP